MQIKDEWLDRSFSAENAQRMQRLGLKEQYLTASALEKCERSPAL